MQHVESPVVIPGARVHAFVSGANRYATVDYSTKANRYLTSLRPDLSFPDWEERGLRDVDPSEMRRLAHHLLYLRHKQVVCVKEVLRAGEGRRKYFVCWEVTQIDFDTCDVITRQEDRDVTFALHDVVLLFQAP